MLLLESVPKPQLVTDTQKDVKHSSIPWLGGTLTDSTLRSRTSCSYNVSRESASSCPIYLCSGAVGFYSSTAIEASAIIADGAKRSVRRSSNIYPYDSVSSLPQTKDTSHMNARVEIELERKSLRLSWQGQCTSTVNLDNEGRGRKRIAERLRLVEPKFFLANENLKRAGRKSCF